MEYKDFQMGIFTKENICMGNSMEKVNIFGSTVLHMKVILSKAIVTVKVYGNQPGKEETSILVLMKMIKSVGMEDTFGQMALYTKENLKMMQKAGKEN